MPPVLPKRKPTDLTVVPELEPLGGKISRDGNAVVFHVLGAAVECGQQQVRIRCRVHGGKLIDLVCSRNMGKTIERELRIGFSDDHSPAKDGPVLKPSGNLL